MNMTGRRPNLSAVYEQDRQPGNAPNVKVAITTPWIVALWLFWAPVVLAVSISGKCFTQSDNDVRLPSPD